MPVLQPDGEVYRREYNEDEARALPCGRSRLFEAGIGWVGVRRRGDTREAFFLVVVTEESGGSGGLPSERLVLVRGGKGARMVIVACPGSTYLCTFVMGSDYRARAFRFGFQRDSPSPVLPRGRGCRPFRAELSRVPF